MELVILLFALIVAGFVYLRRSDQPRTRTERKLAKLTETKPVGSVISGGPRMCGRPRLMDVRDVVAEMKEHRPTAVTVNTVLLRQGLDRSSVRLVRRLLRRLAKRGLVRALPPYPSAPRHLALRYTV